MEGVTASVVNAHKNCHGDQQILNKLLDMIVYKHGCNIVYKSMIMLEINSISLLYFTFETSYKHVFHKSHKERVRAFMIMIIGTNSQRNKLIPETIFRTQILIAELRQTKFSSALFSAGNVILGDIVSACLPESHTFLHS